MYTRSYYGDMADALKIPDNYDGTSLLEKEGEAADADVTAAEDTSPKLMITKGVVEEVRQTQSEEAVSKNVGESGLFQKLRLPDISRLPFLGGLLGGSRHLEGFFRDFGFEDLLLIGLALLLFFSKTGDKECALIILVLLFIK